ncbi:MAG: hypothetical protein MRJ96_15930 [Nitrospirales bacterium]|nr:hypothetical protein [Nitrospira sp.]MDR4502934.1 hypothetical protein [Nitrospirales bacterium]
MSQETLTPEHIKITETLLRLYVLLSQYLDRCLACDEKGAPLSEEEFQKHLRETRAEAANWLSTNRIVPEKVEQEYERVLKSGDALSKNPQDAELKAQVDKEREVLRVKTVALSDLLAVFRSL